MWDNRYLLCGSLCLFLLEPSDSFAQSLDCGLAAAHLLVLVNSPKIPPHTHPGII